LVWVQCSPNEKGELKPVVGYNLVNMPVEGYNLEGYNLEGYNLFNINMHKTFFCHGLKFLKYIHIRAIGMTL